MVLLTVGCSKDEYVEDPGRKDATEENARIKAAVEEIASKASKSGNKLSAIEVWKRGYLTSGAWLGGTTRTTTHQMWSVTKTFTGMAVGLAIEEGKVSLDDNVAGMFPDEVAAAKAAGTMTDAELANMSALTVKDLLTMQDGHISDPTVVYMKDYASKNILSILAGFDNYVKDNQLQVDYLLSQVGSTVPMLFFQHPFKVAPGTTFQYDSFASCLLSEIILRKTGTDIADYLYTRLFKPLGIDRPAWQKVQGVSAGGWGLYLATGDMISFGRVLLDGGKWNDSQLLPAAYVKDALTYHAMGFSNSSKDSSGKYVNGYYTDGYGYHIWLQKDGSMFLCTGLFGQYIIILPKKDAVIAIATDFEINASNLMGLMVNQAGGSNTEALDLVWDILVPVL